MMNRGLLSQKEKVPEKVCWQKWGGRWGWGGMRECPARLVRLQALLWGGPGTPLKMRKVAPQQDEQALASRDHATIKTRAGIY